MAEPEGSRGGCLGVGKLCPFGEKCHQKNKNEQIRARSALSQICASIGMPIVDYNIFACFFLENFTCIISLVVIQSIKSCVTMVITEHFLLNDNQKSLSQTAT